MQTKKLNKKSTSRKKLNGIVYTPAWIVKTILDDVGYKDEIYNKKIIDPACGDGAFLVPAIERFINNGISAGITKKKIKKLLEDNVYGFDIDDRAVEECRSNLSTITHGYGLKNVKWRIIKTDSLNREFVENYFNKFDFVVGNPPYIRIQHLGKGRREKLQAEWSLCKYGSTDIFIAFFELGYKLLNQKGKLGYITPNTFLKTRAGESLRCFLQNSKSLKKLIDFGHNQIFENATTYSLITVLDKNHKKDKFALYKGDNNDIKYIDEIDLNNLNINNWILAPNKVLEKIEKIEQRGLPLGAIADVHVGVTTLADNYYIFENPTIRKNIATISLKNGKSFDIEKKILKPIIKASILKNADQRQNRYIIFPYKKIMGKHSIIPEKELKKEYPLTYRYFKSIENILLSRDNGKPNSVAWYAFGRSQGLDTSFGKKILTSPINQKPHFIVWEKDEYTFYAGYCIKFDGDLKRLAECLNSSEMEFYINHTSRDYQNEYKSFAKSFIQRFGIRQTKLDLDLNPPQKSLFNI